LPALFGICGWLRLSAAMPRATDGLTPAPLLTPFFARQKGRPGKVGHNVALRHSADSAAAATDASITTQR